MPFDLIFARDPGFQHAEAQHLTSWELAFGALGYTYTAMLTLATVVGFALTLAILLRGRGAERGFALLFIVPLPFFIGAYAGLHGLVTSYLLIASASAMPEATALAEANAMAYLAPLIGLALSLPAYLLAAAGLTVRSFHRASS